VTNYAEECRKAHVCMASEEKKSQVVIDADHHFFFCDDELIQYEPTCDKVTRRVKFDGWKIPDAP
jgi:hypothetical protein